MNSTIMVLAETCTASSENPWPGTIISLAIMAFMAWLMWLFFHD